jgi:hypothetical protein
LERYNEELYNKTVVIEDLKKLKIKNWKETWRELAEMAKTHKWL